ncbi:MAG: hypothetical protein JRH05_17230 [Deltaproteobacteria bacterium]|nr:hypothetical protein [Deltaproteobacteria bacterium]
MSKETFNLPEQFEKTASPVTVLRGLGPKRAGPLAERGIRSVADLLFFFPSRYEDRRVVSPMGSLREGTTPADWCCCGSTTARGTSLPWQAREPVSQPLGK